MFRRLFPILIPLFVAACGGPFVLLPGGALEGEIRPVPTSWEFAGDYGTGQLETAPDDPYSVNLAYTILGNRIYLNAGDTETVWVKNMTADPDVRLRIGDAIYEMTAERVHDRSEIAAFGRAWLDQSRFRRDPSELDEVWIYRLRPR